VNVADAAQWLVECLCDQLVQSLGGPVCQCCLAPGNTLPMDYCGGDECDTCNDGSCTGQAAVNVLQIYPTTQFPTPAVDARRCATYSWAALLSMTVFRCAAVQDEKGCPPPCDAQTHDALVAWSDAEAMHRAVLCCFLEGRDPCDADLVIGTWTPVGPDGGCHGGTLTVTVPVAPPCCPPESPPASPGGP
jgi:hypothetical protein